MRERLMKDAKTFADKAKVTIRRNRSQSIAKLRKESPNLGKDSLKRIEDAVSISNIIITLATVLLMVYQVMYCFVAAN
jgi:ribosome recycling factor